MTDKKIDSEVLQKLQEEMKGKMAAITEIAKELQERSMKLPEELTKIGDVRGVKMVADALRKLEEEAKEKKERIETALKDLQNNIASLKTLKDKAKTGDITGEVKSILATINEKQRSLKEAIKDIETLKGKYTKKFFG